MKNKLLQNPNYRLLLWLILLSPFIIPGIFIGIVLDAFLSGIKLWQKFKDDFIL